jgi:hypothetical protein
LHLAYCSRLMSHLILYPNYVAKSRCPHNARKIWKFNMLNFHIFLFFSEYNFFFCKQHAVELEMQWFNSKVIDGDR